MKKFLSATIFAAILLSISASGWCESPVLYQDPTTGQVFTKPAEGRVPVDLSTLSQAPATQAAPAEAAAPAGDYSSQAFKDAVTSAIGEKEAKTFPRVKIGGLMYGEYYYNFDKESRTLDNGHEDPKNAFTLNRGYLNVNADLSPEIGARITSDLSRLSTGDFEYRLKYYYVDFHKFLPFYQGMEVKLGQFQGPWLDYEEGLWEYRVVDNMMIEKQGYINSASLGANFQGPLPAGYGAWQVSVDNGEGYHSDEHNKYKSVEARITLKPVPQVDALKDLQFSGYAKVGKGDFAHKMDRYIAFAGYKYHDDFFVAGEYDWTRGVDPFDKSTLVNGPTAITAVNPDGENNVEGHGFSTMAWVRMPFWKPVRILGRYDQFRHNDHVAGTTVTQWIYGVSYDVSKNVMFVLDNDRTITGTTLKTLGQLDNNFAKLDLQVSF